MVSFDPLLVPTRLIVMQKVFPKGILTQTANGSNFYFD